MPAGVQFSCWSWMTDFKYKLSRTPLYKHKQEMFRNVFRLLKSGKMFWNGVFMCADHYFGHRRFEYVFTEIFPVKYTIATSCFSLYYHFNGTHACKHADCNVWILCNHVNVNRHSFWSVTSSCFVKTLFLSLVTVPRQDKSMKYRNKCTHQNAVIFVRFCSSYTIRWIGIKKVTFHMETVDLVLL